MSSSEKKPFSTERKWPWVLVVGIGEVGLEILDSIAKKLPIGVELVALASDADALRRSAASIRLRLGTKLDRELVAGLLSGADAILPVVVLDNPTARRHAGEIIKLTSDLRLATFAAVGLPSRRFYEERRWAERVLREIGAVADAQLVIDFDQAPNPLELLGTAVLECVGILAGEGARAGVAEIVERVHYQGKFVSPSGFPWRSGKTRSAPTRGGSTRDDFGMEEETEESIFLGGGRKPPEALAIGEPPPGAPAAPVSTLPPAPTVDKASFTVTAPKTVTPGEGFLLDVWAHTSDQLKDVLARAGREISHKTSGPVRLAQGTELVVEVKIADFPIEEPQGVIEWLGEVGNANFAVTVPRETRAGRVFGKAMIHAAGIRTLTLNFQLDVGKAKSDVTPLPAWEVRYRTAFASYASQDRNEVIGRIQGMQKIAPDFDVFLDVATLRSGEKWEERLWQEIPRRDVFFLFWSKHAKESPWVEKEWRLALETKGIEFIDPVPLVPPHEAPPPPELGSKHFNDKWLAFRRAPA